MKALESSSGLDLTPLLPGTRVGKHYVVIETLGVGSKSIAYMCHHEVMLQGAPVAVKLLHPSLLDDARTAKRFEKELIASYQVTHPNVIRTYEYIADQDTIGYSMEFAAGGSLRQLLREKGRLSIENAVQMATQICAGLQAIHAAGIIHRDLKPGNILFSERGTAKIGDFGVALTSFGPRLTNEGELLGTVGYASPEYLQTGLVDERSDIYALGLIMHEAISGEFPFAGRNPLEALRERMHRDPKPLVDLRPDCPKGLSLIVARAMSRDPKARFQDAGQMLAALRDLHTRCYGHENSVFPDTRLSSVEGVMQALRNEPARNRGSLVSIFKSKRAKAVVGSVGVVTALLCATLFMPRAKASIESNAVKAALSHKVAALGEQTTNERSAPAVAHIEDEAADLEIPEAEPAAALDAPAAVEPAETNDLQPTLVEKELAPLIEEVSIPQTPPMKSDRYAINRGDTLSALSLRLRVPMTKLVDLNGIANPDLILAGEELKLPTPANE